MLRRIVIVGLLVSAALQPAFGDDFKFRVTPNKDYELGLTIFDGPLMLLDACWSNARVDLDWALFCDFEDDFALVALSASDEEKCEDMQVGVFGGSDGLDCVAVLFSNGGTGKGQGSLRFTGTEFINSRSTAEIKAAPISIDDLGELRTKIEGVKASSRNRKLRK